MRRPVHIMTLRCRLWAASSWKGGRDGPRLRRQAAMVDWQGMRDAESRWQGLGCVPLSAGGPRPSPQVAALVRQCMEGSYANVLRVPLRVRLAAGPSWGELRDLELPTRGEGEGAAAAAEAEHDGPGDTEAAAEDGSLQVDK